MSRFRTEADLRESALVKLAPLHVVEAPAVAAELVLSSLSNMLPLARMCMHNPSKAALELVVRACRNPSRTWIVVAK